MDSKQRGMEFTYQGGGLEMVEAMMYNVIGFLQPQYLGIYRLRSQVPGSLRLTLLGTLKMEFTLSGLKP